MLLEAAEAHDREVARSTGETPDEVRQLLPRLRDPGYARVLLVTLPEATPVHEAARLADDLRRAGITPHAWIVNQSLTSTQPSDPLLAARARLELPYIREARGHADRLAVVPWRHEPPTGSHGLTTLLRAS